MLLKFFITNFSLIILKSVHLHPNQYLKLIIFITALCTDLITRKVAKLQVSSRI
jgi:hypothetical protein